MLPHAPGVQMQAIPEDAIPEESGDEDEEDPDKRISSKTQTPGASTFLLCRLFLLPSTVPGSTFSPSCPAVENPKFSYL